MNRVRFPRILEGSSRRGLREGVQGQHRTQLRPDPDLGFGRRRHALLLFARRDAGQDLLCEVGKVAGAEAGLQETLIEKWILVGLPAAERRAVTRSEILSAAWDVCRADGIAALSMREVARRVGLQPPSLYSYFDSKNAIYDAMFAQASAEFVAGDR